MKILFVLLILLAPAPALADGLYAYMAIAPDAFPIGSARIGSGDWEGGFLANGFLGFNKRFRKKWTYFGFGLGGSPGFSAGVYASAGVEFKMIGTFKLRGEMAATGATNSFIKGSSQIGLSFYF